MEPAVSMMMMAVVMVVVVVGEETLLASLQFSLSLSQLVVLLLILQKSFLRDTAKVPHCLFIFT